MGFEGGGGGALLGGRDESVSTDAATDAATVAVAVAGTVAAVALELLGGGGGGFEAGGGGLAGKYCQESKRRYQFAMHNKFGATLEDATVVCGVEDVTVVWC